MESKNRQLARHYMRETIIMDVSTGNLRCLQQLWEQFNPDNSKLVAKCLEERLTTETMEETIFTDMGNVLFDEAETDSAVLATFKDIYCKKYPRAVTAAESVKSGKKREQFKSSSEDFLCAFLLVWPECFLSDNEVLANLGDIESIALSDREYHADRDLRYPDGELIYPSRQFRRFVDRHLKGLVTYLQEQYPDRGITTSNIYDILPQILKFNDDNHGALGGGPETIATYSALQIIMQNTGGLSWYTQMPYGNERKTNWNHTGYKPDMHKIIDIYYRSVLRREIINRQNNNNTRTFPIDVARHIHTISAETDFLAISYVYNLDVYYKMMTDLLETYYRNFSFEHLFREDLKSRLYSIISRLEKEKNDQAMRIDSLMEENRNLDIQLSKTESTKSLAYEQQITRLTKKATEYENEIARLEEMVKSRDKYIALLSEPELETSEDEPDLNMLRGRRYLFIGRNENIVTELKRIFPDSVFMENERFKLSGIQVDAVVFLIKLMSHAMFYKATHSATINNAPTIYCNSTSLKNVYVAIERQFK